jgi:hypothetical protein
VAHDLQHLGVDVGQRIQNGLRERSVFRLESGHRAWNRKGQRVGYGTLLGVEDANRLAGNESTIERGFGLADDLAGVPKLHGAEAGGAYVGTVDFRDHHARHSGSTISVIPRCFRWHP